jgi:hypothetical protein
MVFLFFLFFSSASVNGLGIMEWRRVCFARVFFLGLVVRSEYTVKREVVNHGIPRSGLFFFFFLLTRELRRGLLFDNEWDHIKSVKSSQYCMGGMFWKRGRRLWAQKESDSSQRQMQHNIITGPFFCQSKKAIMLFDDGVSCVIASALFCLSACSLFYRPFFILFL